MMKICARFAGLLLALFLVLPPALVWALTPPPVPIESVQITGLPTGEVGEVVTLTASSAPVTLTQPVTYTWLINSPAGITEVVSAGGITNALELTLSAAGNYTVVVVVRQESPWPQCPRNPDEAAELFQTTGNFSQVGNCGWLITNTLPVSVTIPQWGFGDWWNGNNVRTYGPAVISTDGVAIWRYAYGAAASQAFVVQAVLPPPVVWKIYLPLVRKDAPPAPPLLPVAPECATSSAQAAQLFGGTPSMWFRINLPGCGWFFDTGGQAVNLAIQRQHRFDNPGTPIEGPQIVSNYIGDGAIWRLEP